MEARAIICADGEAETWGVTTSVPWWSFTKTALSVALLRLSEGGRIDLDKAVDGKPFTAAQLLRHEAGLPDYGSLAAYHVDVEAGGPPWTVDALMKAADADRLLYEPGQGWGYSNIGYWHAARLIERASDRPLADALADLVFAPADLSTARLAAVPADLASVSMGDATSYHPGWVYHGLIVGTAMDAAHLLHRLLQGTLLERNAFSRMLKARPLPQFRSERYPDPAYGMGLMFPERQTRSTHSIIGHSGGGPGSEIAVYGQRGTTCAIWAASSTCIDPVAEVFRTLKNDN
jgi:CubicO group peptidase (beta-lactamase class C family)